MNTPNDFSPETQDQPLNELFLLHLRYKEARLLSGGANQPLLLNDPATSWVVYTGRVDLFAVRWENGRAAGPRTHLLRLGPGEALFGFDAALSPDLALIAVGSPQTSLLKIPTQRLQALSRDSEFRPLIVGLIERWVRGLSEQLAVTLPPKESVRLQPNREVKLEDKGSASAGREIVWVSHVQGASYFMGNTRLPRLNGQGRWPLSSRTWLASADQESLVQAIDTSLFLDEEPSWRSLTNFNWLVLRSVALKLQGASEAAQSHLQQKWRTNQTLIEHALTRLADPLKTAESPLKADSRPGAPLLKACQLVGDYLGVKIQSPEHSDLINRRAAPLDEIARASRLRLRRVALKGEWWKQDSGPLLAITEAGRPVALLPRSPQLYILHDPITGEQQSVSAEVATTLNAFAYTFYRPFPAHALSVWELLKFGLGGQLADLRAIILVGLAVGLLGMLAPMATGFVFDQIIPRNEANQLLQVCLALLVIALATAGFQITQNVAILRLQGRLGAAVQASVWDRLMSLPASFFRNYTAGDLGSRAMGIDTIQQMLSSTVLSAILAAIFSLSSFFLLFHYSRPLAVAATGLMVVAVGVTLATGYLQVVQQRQLTHIQGRISGRMLQLISGITKFRAAGAESRAFNSWAEDFSHLRQTSWQARQIANRLSIFNTVYPLVTSLVIFSLIAFALQQTLSVGQFLAFNAAFGQFMASVLALSGTVIAVLNVVPIYERAQPILSTLPEVDELKSHPGELTGRIEISHVSFQYSPETPLVVRDATIIANPGEFIALVGPSGSGKSTLLRLLLGFETPTTGAVYYDGHNLADVDVRAIRRQIGVVLQDGTLLGGDIYSNIVGASLLTMEDAWLAAARAGVADDIRQMPMQMHTLINTGGGVLSGGQRQRLLIARALAHKPRILLFDEATSALDNHTQQVVNDSLENLQATRVVIAHRLSTIIKADRIYVLDQGRVVQSGSYQELINQEGLFADLARRQMV